MPVANNSLCTLSVNSHISYTWVHMASVVIYTQPRMEETSTQLYLSTNSICSEGIYIVAICTSEYMANVAIYIHVY